MTDNHPFSVRILPSALPTTAFRAVENHSRLCHESTIHCVSKPPSPSSATLSIVGNSHYRQRPFHFSKPTFHYEGRLPPPTAQATLTIVGNHLHFSKPTVYVRGACLPPTAQATHTPYCRQLTFRSHHIRQPRALLQAILAATSPSTLSTTRHQPCQHIALHSSQPRTIANQCI